ncbi:hypothetical protein [Paenibacillus amylolyticus]|nr:hypothetical protein [Paenibacillus amylolyticus]
MINANYDQHNLVTSLKEIIQSTTLKDKEIYKVERSAKLTVKIKLK